MQTLSSARRTCMASASAVEWTATVRIPISRQARWMRSAISPRFAIRTFSNMGSAKDQQRLAVFDRLTVVDQDLLDRSRLGRGDRVHDLHGLDDQQGLSLLHSLADLDVGRATRLGGEIGGAHHG